MRKIVIALLGFVITAGAPPIAAQQIGRAPLDIAVPAAPAAIHALGRAHVVYELHVTNMGRSELTLDRLVTADADGHALADWQGPALRTRMSVVGQPPAGGPTAMLAPGRRAIVWMWITLAPGEAPPSSIAHQFTASAAGVESETVVARGVPVRSTTSATAAPVGSGNWVAVRGPSPTSPHRLSLVTLDGCTRAPQRFAVDLVRLGDDGRAFHDDATNVKNWYGWDAPVHAIASGTVVRVRDDAPDHAAMEASVPDVMDRDEAPGNVVVIDLGGGRYATYAHLHQGSARVVAGERVSAGQMLARIGNSGNTRAPHLHFQITDTAEPLAGEGLPFALDRAELVGRIPDLAALLAGTPWAPVPSMPARTMTAETPLENMVLAIGAVPLHGGGR